MLAIFTAPFNLSVRPHHQLQNRFSLSSANLYLWREQKCRMWQLCYHGWACCFYFIHSQCAQMSLRFWVWSMRWQLTGMLSEIDLWWTNHSVFPRTVKCYLKITPESWQRFCPAFLCMLVIYTNATPYHWALCPTLRRAQLRMLIISSEACVW